MKRILFIVLCLGLVGCAGISKSTSKQMEIKNLETSLSELQVRLAEREEGIKNLQRLLEEKETSIEELRKKLEMFGVFEK